RLGAHGPVVRPHAVYLGLFPEARSSARRAPPANQGTHQRAENHHSLGPVGGFWVLTHPWLGPPLRVVTRPALANDSLPSPLLLRLSDHPLGHERKQLCLPHRPGRGRAPSDLHRTLSLRPASHVLRRDSHVRLHAAGAGLLVGPAGFSSC